MRMVINPFIGIYILIFSQDSHYDGPPKTPSFDHGIMGMEIDPIIIPLYIILYHHTQHHNTLSLLWCEVLK